MRNSNLPTRSWKRPRRSCGNEELHTVNTELNSKIDELDRANSDLRNLFESTQIATVLPDGELIIRSFTPAVTTIFNLISTDGGRRSPTS